MNIQDYVNAILKQQRIARLQQSDQLTLGKILSKLKPIVELHSTLVHDESGRIGVDPEVYFDFEQSFPISINSWRGSYNELALGFENIHTNEKPMKLTAFNNMMNEAIGKTFYGYKGGEFTMFEETPVWVDNYGKCGNRAVIDVVDTGERVLIITGEREY